MRPIPVEAAHKIAVAYGYDQVIIFARKPGEGDYVTSYGAGDANWTVAARIAIFFKQSLAGWPRKTSEREAAERFAARHNGGRLSPFRPKEAREGRP